MSSSDSADARRWPCLSTPAGAPGCVLAVAAAPGSRRTGADGLHDGCLRIRLTAPAVDGKANDALLSWLASELCVPRRGVQLLRGTTSRRKQVAIAAPVAQVARWLAGLAAADPDAPAR